MGTTRYSVRGTDRIRHRRQGSGHGEGQLDACAFNPLSTFTTPTIDQIERETVTPTVSDDALVTPGTLTVALDTSDAPQAMQDADGNLTGYAVDAARALACRMGLKVAFVDASSADSALSDKKADIFIGDIKSAGGDISSLCTMPPPYSARAVTASR